MSYLLCFKIEGDFFPSRCRLDMSQSPMFSLVASGINSSKTEVAQISSLTWTNLSGTLTSSCNGCYSYASSIGYNLWRLEWWLWIYSFSLKDMIYAFWSFLWTIFKFRNLKVGPEICKSNILICENADHGPTQMNHLQRVLQNWQEKKFGRD